jgi:hypothetical protein
MDRARPKCSRTAAPHRDLAAHVSGDARGRAADHSCRFRDGPAGCCSRPEKRSAGVVFYPSAARCARSLRRGVSEPAIAWPELPDSPKPRSANTKRRSAGSPGWSDGRWRHAGSPSSGLGPPGHSPPPGLLPRPVVSQIPAAAGNWHHLGAHCLGRPLRKLLPPTPPSDGGRDDHERRYLPPTTRLGRPCFSAWRGSRPPFPATLLSPRPARADPDCSALAVSASCQRPRPNASRRRPGGRGACTRIPSVCLRGCAPHPVAPCQWS